jgi:hypothetical protein
MLDKALRVFRAVHRYVVGGESWSSAWEAIKGEIGDDLPTLAGYVSGGLTMFGTLAGDVSWVGIVALTFCAFVAGRQFVIQQQTEQRPNGSIVDDGRASVPAPPSATPPGSPPKVETSEERQAKHDLCVFIIDFVLPACRGQNHLQHVVAYRIGGTTDYMKVIISFGLANESSFAEFIKTLSDVNIAASSNLDIYAFDRILSWAIELRNGYRSFCGRLRLLAPKIEDVLSDPTLSGAFEPWRVAHNALVEKYDEFGRDLRFPGLYQPARSYGFGVPQPPNRYMF